MYKAREALAAGRTRVVALVCAMLCATLPELATAQTSATSAAAAQATTVPKLSDRLAPASRAIIERLADSLKQAGVPWEPLYDKAAEGLLKRATDAVIITAVRTLARELIVASNLLGPSAPVSDVVSAASALRAGVPLAAAQKIAARRSKDGAPDTRLALSFIILSDFAARGVPVDAAVSAVNGLLERGAGSAELAAFRTGVERDLQAGRDARATLVTRAEDVMRRR